MFCPKCGTDNNEGSERCVNCGEFLQKSDTERRPVQYVPNYLVQAILVTIFCCLPFGIVAIVFAAQVNGKLESGNYEGALHSSKQAKTWCWVSFGVGLVFILFYVAMLLIQMATVSSIMG